MYIIFVISKADVKVKTNCTLIYTAYSFTGPFAPVAGVFLYTLTIPSLSKQTASSEFKSFH